MEEKLGHALYDEGIIVIPENLINYIDYEAVGRDYNYSTCGEFIDRGYHIEFI